MPLALGRPPMNEDPEPSGPCPPAELKLPELPRRSWNRLRFSSYMASLRLFSSWYLQIDWTPRPA